MTNILTNQMVADEIIGAAREEASKANNRAEKRMGMVLLMASKLQESGLFPDGVPFDKVMKHIDGIFDASAEFLNKQLVQRKNFKCKSVTGKDIDFDDAMATRLVLRACDSICSKLQKARDEGARKAMDRDRLHSRVEHIPTAAIMQNIEQREAGLRLAPMQDEARIEPLLDAATALKQIEQREARAHSKYPAKKGGR